jgi:hypothetical protein
MFRLGRSGFRLCPDRGTHCEAPGLACGQMGEGSQYFPGSVRRNGMRGSVFAATILLAAISPAQGLLRLTSSLIGFVSDAPMERIEAASASATGLLKIQERSFAVQLPIASLDGFNSPLQREHFNENYLESTVHQYATFSGKIIEAVDLSAPGTYRVRAKGELLIHGVARERIVECVLHVDGRGIQVQTAFDVLLDDHDIRVPRVVQQKVSARVQVKVDMRFGATSAAKR